MTTRKHVNEESMSSDYESQQSSSSQEEDSTAGEDSASFDESCMGDEQISMLELDHHLPEMDERQADRLKRLLLSPLEPDTDFWFRTKKCIGTEHRIILNQYKQWESDLTPNGLYESSYTLILLNKFTLLYLHTDQT